MIHAPIPANEAERIADLRALQLLDSPPEERFDRIIRLGEHIFNLPIVYLALVDADRQWFKAQCGLRATETRRDESFCGHTIALGELMIVPDARKDERFHDNPLVVGEPHVRFYAGHPLKGPKGTYIGTLCVASPAPQDFSADQIRMLGELAALAEHELGMVDLIGVQHELLKAQANLAATQRRLAIELEEAAAYVRALFPARLEGPVRTDWQAVSSSKLGGDAFGYHWLDDHRLAIYLLDVSGHGVGAALLSVSILHALRLGALRATSFDDPAAVLGALNQAFPMAENNQKFVTVWYGVYDKEGRTLRYSAAGHPPAVLMEPSGRASALGSSSFMIGISDENGYQTDECAVRPGSRLFVFSDGVFEVPVRGGAMLGLEGFMDLLASTARNGDVGAAAVREQIAKLQGSTQFGDDFSLLEIVFR